MVVKTRELYRPRMIIKGKLEIARIIYVGTPLPKKLGKKY